MEIAVIGLGRFGTSVATNLAENGVNVTVIDMKENRVNNLLEIAENGYILDSTDEKALSEISIDQFDKVIVGLGKTALNDSLLTCLNLKEMNVNDIVAKASSAPHYKLLKKIGIDFIIQPEHDIGKKLALKLSGNSLVDYIELSNDIRIDNVIVDKKLKSFVNKNIDEINLRKRYIVNIVAIERNHEIIIPDGETIIGNADILVIIGHNEHIDNFEKSYRLV